MVRNFKTEDTQQLLDIYNYYVVNSVATFDTEPVAFEVYSEKLHRINKAYPLIVFEEDDTILGFAYGSKFRPKPAYNGNGRSYRLCKAYSTRKTNRNHTLHRVINPIKTTKLSFCNRGFNHSQCC